MMLWKIPTSWGAVEKTLQVLDQKRPHAIETEEQGCCGPLCRLATL